MISLFSLSTIIVSASVSFFVPSSEAVSLAPHAAKENTIAAAAKIATIFLNFIFFLLSLLFLLFGFFLLSFHIKLSEQNNQC